jgi:small subunit ribosomal protein S20
LANTRQAKKRVRQSERRHLANMALRSTIRTGIRRVREAVAKGTVEEAQQAYRGASSLLDRAVRKGVVHRNHAARLKSRLNRNLKKIVLGQARQAS